MTWARGSRRGTITRAGAMLLVAAIALVQAGCRPPPTVADPGETDRIVPTGETRHVGGYTFTEYRNPDYKCSISGDQTFVIITKDSSSDTAPAPLWVQMHGGGVGWFDPDPPHRPQPSGDKMDEEDIGKAVEDFSKGGLMGAVRTGTAGFRGLQVSMCNHDIYAGVNTPDPNNPDPSRPTNGLLATKAAIQHTLALYPTTKFILRGGSAGSVGSFHVAWGLERQGLRPAGIVADSGVLNGAWEYARIEQLPDCEPGDRDAESLEAIRARLHPEVTADENAPHRLVTEGRLSVPVLHAWSRGDPVNCGLVPMTCPVDGPSVELGAADCAHEPMRRAIQATRGDTGSVNFRLCVEGSKPPACDGHGVTNRDGAPYVPAMYAWVLDRLADD